MLKKSTLIFILSTFFCLAAHAEAIYVTDSLKLKLRVDASNNAEVITNLDSGEKLTLVEKQKKFSKVKTSDGEMGWVQSWFLTDKQPATYIVNTVTKENQALTGKLAAANRKLKNFDSETSRENTKLKNSVATLSEKIKSLGATRNELEEKLDTQASKLAKYEFAEKYNINLIILLFFMFAFTTGFFCSRLWSNFLERKRLWGYQLAH